jgi:hypothetical protein
MSKRYGTLAERFWRHVLPEPNSGCWLWDGPVDSSGYGRFRLGSSKVRVHRVSYGMHHGRPVPNGMRVLHSCDVPACVNPDHLRLGTDADNVADKVARNRQARGERVPGSKLTTAQVMAIRVAQGVTHRALAAEFGVSHNIVGRIRRRQKWTHLTDA